MAQLVVIPPVYSVSPTTLLGPWSSVLYVDNVRGNDTTGTRGNDNRPFATIQAAINAAVTDDTVLLAPQLFATTAALTRPATVTRLILAGSVRKIFGSFGANPGAAIRCTGDDAINLGANLGLTTFVISNLRISTATAGKSAVVADGSAYAVGTYLASGGLQLDNCDLSALQFCISTKYAAFIILSNTRSTTAASFLNFFTLTFYASALTTSAITISSDVGDPLTTQFQPTCNLNVGTQLGGGSNVGVVSWGGQVFFNVDGTSLIGGLKGASLSDHPGAPVAHPGIRMAARIAGSNTGVVDFASAGSELPDTASTLVFDFRQNRFATDANPCTVKFKVVAPSANFQTVQLDGALCVPGTTVIADEAIHLTARGASIPQAVYQTPGATGDIVPPYVEGTVNIAAGGAVAKTWVNLGYAGFIRAGAAPDVALLTPNARGSDPAVPVKATTGLTIDSAVVGGNTACNWRADWK